LIAVVTLWFTPSLYHYVAMVAILFSF